VKRGGGEKFPEKRVYPGDRTPICLEAPPAKGGEPPFSQRVFGEIKTGGFKEEW